MMTESAIIFIPPKRFDTDCAVKLQIAKRILSKRRPFAVV